LNPVPPTLGENTFNECPIVAVYVPSEAIEDYQSAEGWKDFYIVDVANKVVTNFTVDGINYRVSSLQYSRVEVVPSDNRYSGDIVIPEVVTYNDTEYTVTAIGDRAFRNCVDLQSVTLPESVTMIGDYAFLWCTNLQSVTIPGSVTTIRDYAFMECSNLSSFTCTSEVLILGSSVFDDITATAYVPIASADLYEGLDWGGDITIEYLNDYVRSTPLGAFGTICLPYDYISEGATLYSIESIEDNTVVLTMVEGNQGIANTAYLYRATEEEQNFPYVPDEDLNYGEDVTTGVLTSPAEYTIVPEGSYMLQTQDDVQAFYKVDGETYIKPHRAYLTLDTDADSEALPCLYLAFNEGNVTALDAIRALMQGTPAIYDLNGRRLGTLQKGLNIVDGVKVIVK
jgi:hypothetical protein